MKIFPIYTHTRIFEFSLIGKSLGVYAGRDRYMFTMP